MRRRHCVLGLAGLPLAWAARAQADDRPLLAETRLIDRFELAGAALRPSANRQSVEFLPRRDAGPLWAVLDMLAVVDGSGRDEMVFELALLDVPLAATDTVQIVKGSRMALVDASRWPRDDKGRPRSQSGLALAAKDSESMASALSGGRLRRVVVVRTLTYKDPQPTSLRLGLRRADGIQPLRVEVHVGQGPVPRELQALAEQANGPWWRRYSREIAMWSAALGLGALAVWRLRR
jgi:hypothetical protein